MPFADLSGMMGSFDCERQRSCDGTACTSVAKPAGLQTRGMPLNSQGYVNSTRCAPATCALSSFCWVILRSRALSDTSGQKHTHALPQTVSLFDHLISEL